ncbi:MAG TPA: bifunctional phosphopantothenoylcysteine decarboxylase/phosphopantothenate--cysteine ligase CoaBC [Candidatus Krumholzibacteriaceae bacterium]
MRNRERRNNHEGGLSGKKILLVVTGGISAYKSAVLVRLLTCRGSEVRVVMSAAATEFVTPLTFEVLSGNRVSLNIFTRRERPAVEHVELSKWADRVVVAPATADIIAKAALGVADEIASTVLCSSRSPVIFAPAMNEIMWANKAVQRNIETLRADGRIILEPGSGALACGDAGPGRMAEPEDIVKALEASFAPGDLAGVRVLVTAGRTEEEIDPVRYITNRSSGRMGFAIATAARARGAHVTLIHGAVDVPVPRVDAVQGVTTAAEMKSAVTKVFKRCDVCIMAAAVSDFAPVKREVQKIKRKGETLSLELRATEDILASLKNKKKDQIVVGFALETANGEANALKKAREKGCDYMALNAPGEKTGFSVPTNRITLFRGQAKLFTSALLSKEDAATVILDALAADRRVKRFKR